jgi:DNA repair protein RadC
MVTLYVNDAGTFQPATDDQVIRSARSGMAQRFRRERGSSIDLRRCAYLQQHLGQLVYEVFGCLYLNTLRRLIAAEDLFHGTIDSAPVHAREVIRGFIQHAASALILYHNHPSGVAEPSKVDEQGHSRSGRSPR